jgi:hypothetical protein
LTHRHEVLDHSASGGKEIVLFCRTAIARAIIAEVEQYICILYDKVRPFREKIIFNLNDERRQK